MIIAISLSARLFIVLSDIDLHIPMLSQTGAGSHHQASPLATSIVPLPCQSPLPRTSYTSLLQQRDLRAAYHHATITESQSNTLNRRINDSSSLRSATSTMPTYNMGAASLNTTFQIAQLITAFAGIALYNVTELLVLITLTFRRRTGLYYYSLLLSTLAITPYTFGLLFKFFGPLPNTLLYFDIAIIDVGWQVMVTGQSIVLYSRLHLVASSRTAQRWILAMIVANVFVSNIPTTIFVFASASPDAAPFVAPYAFWERFQLCCYFVQETIISGFYVVEIARMLRPEGRQNPFTEAGQGRRDQDQERRGTAMRAVSSARGREVMKHLLYVNVVIVILDITLLVTEFIGHYEIQVLYKVLTTLSPSLCKRNCS